MAFTQTWVALQGHLRVGTVVPNWTADNGYLGDSFLITSVGPQTIVADSPNAKNNQIISQNDFGVVYHYWNDYCSGIVPRNQIRDATRFSKYVISILHWLENQLGGTLP